MKFQEFAERWLCVHSEDVCSKQKDCLRQAVSHANRFIGDMELCDIMAYDLDLMISELHRMNPNTGKPMSKRYLRLVRNTCKRIFEYAAENGLCDKNPAANRKIPRNAPETKRRALTSEEQNLVFLTPHRARIGALIMMLCGLRRGELIPLRWEDIDLPGKTIHVYRSVEDVNGHFQIKSGTKTDEGRYVPIPSRLSDLLLESKSLPHYSFVCPSAHGRLHTPTSWRKMWNSYLLDLNAMYWCQQGKHFNKFDHFSSAGTPIQISAHMLRHTYATILFTAGVDVLTASKLLGHKDVKTTIAIYTHLAKEKETVSISKFEEYISSIFPNLDE